MTASATRASFGSQFAVCSAQAPGLAQQPGAICGLQREAPFALSEVAEVRRAGAGPPVVLLRRGAYSG